jgi:hypothetical protein
MENMRDDGAGFARGEAALPITGAVLLSAVQFLSGCRLITSGVGDRFASTKASDASALAGRGPGRVASADSTEVTRWSISDRFISKQEAIKEAMEELVGKLPRRETAVDADGLPAPPRGTATVAVGIVR